jgi:putative ABC transport system permease protein
MIWNAIPLALRAIRRNVMRSSLTVLGIVIGVSAVIIMVTLGNGATARVTEDISSLGTNLLMVMPGQERFGPGTRDEEVTPFEEDDIQAVRNEITGVEAVAPNNSSSMQAIYGNQNWSTSVYGVDNAYFEARNWPVVSGREFTSAELAAGQAVCIIGATIQKELLGGEDPVGLKIRLNAMSFQIVGVLESKGQSGMGMDQDDAVLIPLRTFQRRVSGNRFINMFFVKAKSTSSIETVQASLERLLRQRRNVQADEDDDFFVHSSQELMSTLTGTTRLLTALLGAVAAVSLLVGGIGIMNIMLVSVTERTSEIGVRLAIGALEGDVMTQFLVEAVVLSSFGGIVGITIGMTISILGAGALNVPFVFDPGIVIASFVFSALVGIVFGYFPAQRAARLDPIESLRHE